MSLEPKPHAPRIPASMIRRSLAVIKMDAWTKAAGLRLSDTELELVASLRHLRRTQAIRDHALDQGADIPRRAVVAVLRALGITPKRGPDIGFCYDDERFAQPPDILD